MRFHKINNQHCMYVVKEFFIINICNLQRACDCNKKDDGDPCGCQDDVQMPAVKSDIVYPYVIEPVYDSNERLTTQKKEIQPKLPAQQSKYLTKPK